MQITITSKHMTITPAIEDYARKKAEKLLRFYDQIHQIELVIDKAKIGFELEVIVDVTHHDRLVATSEHEDLYACIDLATDRSTRQVRELKSRLRDNKHHTPTGGREV